MFERIRAHLGPADAIRLFSSLILALLLWGWVTNLQNPDQTETLYNLTITPEGIPEGMQIVGQLPPASVQVTAPKSTIDDLTASSVSLSVDLSDFTKPGKYTAPVEVKAPHGIRKRNPSPSTVQVRLDNTVSIQMPLTVQKPNLAGDPRTIQAITTNVQSVNVTGANSIVQTVAKVVLPIDIGNNTSDFQGEFTPIAQNSKGQDVTDVTIQPSPVTATVRLQARGKSVAVLSPITGDPAPGYEVVDKTVNPSTVLIDGPAAELANVFAVSAAPVDVSGKSDTVTAHQQIVNLPKDIQVVRPTDGTVVVVVQIRQHTEPQPIPGITIHPIGLNSQDNLTISPQTVKLQLIAPEQTLSTLKPSDIQVQVNVTGLAPGVYTLTPTVSVPPDVQWTNMQPQSVKVTITRRGRGTPAATPIGASPPATPVAAPPKGTP